MPAISIFKWLHVSTLWCYRAITWLVLICACLFALVIVGVRFWLLPNIGKYREPIARELSDATHQRITIGKLDGRWSGLNLQLTLGDLVVYDGAGQPALTLQRVDGTLSWWSLVLWEPRFDSIEIRRPDLNITRDARGVISVAGIELERSGGGGLADWLLRQQEISIREASIGWQDDMRAAPRLALQNVDFRLENDGKHHRFGLRAEPPAALATPLDVRGDFTGRTVTDLTQWNGQVFTQLEYTDISAWRAWVPFPVSFPHGAGAVRAWAGLKNGTLAEITADVQLSQVTTRLGTDLPELDLAELKGRVGWKALDDGFEVATTRLGMSTHNYTLQPTDFLLRYHRGTAARPARGELQANTLDVEPLFALADHLPLDAALRKEFEAYAPRGSFYDVAVKWTGEWPRPQQYGVKARFVNLGLNAVGQMPGLAGVSGSVDGSERGGTLLLSTQHAVVELPLVFQDKLEFDVLTAQAGWQRKGEQYEIRFNNISFSNRDLAGSLTGAYQTAAEGRGAIDLTGHATRADVRSVARYIPLRIGERGRQWMTTALVGGSSNDVKLRVKGNLSDFPYPEGKGGVFQVTARVVDGVLDYANGWPRIDNLEGDLTFRGRRMDIVVREGAIGGVKLARVRAEIPDLATPERVLTVTGDAEGATSEFQSFIDHSPVLDMTDRFTQTLRADGRGKLALKLTIPLANVKGTKVAGDYQFLNNRIESDDVFFPFEQVNGRLEFTETGVRVPTATMTILGGPATLTGGAQREGVMRLSLAGRANMDNFRRSSAVPLAQALRGSTDWKTTITLRKRLADIVFESNLQGIVSELPAPLSKAAAESMPVRLERTVIGPQEDRIGITLGSLLSAQLQRRKDGADSVIERGTISLGGVAPEPERKGIWVSGSLKSLDLDQWLLLLRAGGGDAGRAQIAGIDVKFGTLDLFGRRFNELGISGSAQPGVWQTTINGRELVGEMTWRSQGRGKVTARMKSFAIPAITPDRPLPATIRDQPLELPALDIKADNFQVRQANLGKLDLTAVPDGRDWKLEKLYVINPDATLSIEGVWQGWLTHPRTMVNVRLDVNDIGKFLVRLGQPEGVRRGTAKLEGPLSWAGSPAEIDYATLSGNFVLEANKGQFVKLDPGIGKLLGVLSLQSLPRRLSLDFRDIFSEGLAFDEIVGTVKVNRGIANTENFRIQGPAVRIQMSGDVDLARETQKLRVKVFPSMSDSLSIAGALIGGPIAGIATFVAQKLLKDPIDKIAAYEYDVTGKWADPQVSKVVREQSKAAIIPMGTERSD
ncbi:MAG: YhdP family protein [Burkholderiales bacterium]